MNRNFMAVAATALAAVLCVSYPAFAHKVFLEKVRRQYGLDKKNGECNLCHEIKPKEEPSAKNLNKYGKAINDDLCLLPLTGKKEDYKFTDAELQLMLKVVQSLDDKDSDGDGATNKEELDLGYYPGDAKSTPTKKELADYRKKNPKKPK